MNIAKIEKVVKTGAIRLLLVAISVAVSAIYWNNEKKQYFEEAQQLRTIVDEVKEQKLRLESEFSKLKANMLLISVADDNYPNPKWMKSTDLMMLKLNKAYEDVYLKPFDKKREDYVGMYDYDIWPDDVAHKYRKNDFEVLKSGKPITFTEMVPDGNGNTNKVQVTKYPIKINGVTIGVGGFSVIKHIEKKL